MKISEILSFTEKKLHGEKKTPVEESSSAYPHLRRTISNEESLFPFNPKRATPNARVVQIEGVLMVIEKLLQIN